MEEHHGMRMREGEEVQALDLGAAVGESHGLWEVAERVDQYYEMEAAGAKSFLYFDLSKQKDPDIK